MENKQEQGGYLTFRLFCQERLNADLDSRSIRFHSVLWQRRNFDKSLNLRVAASLPFMGDNRVRTNTGGERFQTFLDLNNYWSLFLYTWALQTLHSNNNRLQLVNYRQGAVEACNTGLSELAKIEGYHNSMPRLKGVSFVRVRLVFQLLQEWNYSVFLGVWWKPPLQLPHPISHCSLQYVPQGYHLQNGR